MTILGMPLVDAMGLGTRHPGVGISDVLREQYPFEMAIVLQHQFYGLEVREHDFEVTLSFNKMPETIRIPFLAMFRSRGYSFVTLEQALADDVYRLPEDYVGRGGFSWIHRWTRTKGLPTKAEPEPPAWVSEAWSNR